MRNYGSSCKTSLLGFQFASYLWSSIPNDLQVTFAYTTCYTLTATAYNKPNFLSSFVIVFLCQQNYSHSFTQEVCTGRRKDQRWWLQEKLKRKVFLWFLSWPKVQVAAERHHSAMQQVSGKKHPRMCWCLLLSFWWQNSKLLDISSFPTCTEAAASQNCWIPGSLGMAMWHLQLRTRCPWAPATCRPELAMKNECFWGDNNLKLSVGFLKKTTKPWEFSKPCHRWRWQTLALLWTEHRHYVCELNPFCRSFLICATPG